MASEPAKQLNLPAKSGSNNGAQVRQPTQAELKLIEQWVLLGNSFGVPRSVSRIYGLMFVAPDALTANQCVITLKLSRSSAGQGIRLLLEVGAIKPLLEIGKREESYVIEPDLGVLVKNLLQGRFMPTIEQFLRGIPLIDKLAEEEENVHIKDRIDKLKRWQTKLAPFKSWLDLQL